MVSGPRVVEGDPTGESPTGPGRVVDLYVRVGSQDGCLSEPARGEGPSCPSPGVGPSDDLGSSRGGGSTFRSRPEGSHEDVGSGDRTDIPLCLFEGQRRREGSPHGNQTCTTHRPEVPHVPLVYSGVRVVWSPGRKSYVGRERQG